MILSLLFFSCSEDTNDTSQVKCVPHEEQTDTSSVKVSINWNFESFAFAVKANKLSYFRMYSKRYANNGKIFISFFGLDKDSILYEDMFLTNIPFKAGCYNITETYSQQNIGTGADYSTNDHDILLDQYFTDTANANNRIEILHIDSVNHLIEGSFAISFQFQNQKPKKDPDTPDKIRFFNGYFKGKYE
ncbi:MAG TPA: hypothetical protein PKD32_00435 [Saprospiraceae bacterium]|nr:hypothetical protein [Saprospiraceae bacterium]